MTIKGVPAGTYNMVVHFSNEAFIGKHDYNPQVVDLGLQVRQNNVDPSAIPTRRRTSLTVPLT